ncbi:MAG TPA: M28 family metallopeptidase [Allosphingosinicella sp.]|nr:M28 family metallopeptidase [Allosphingosinicella sp.]
MIVRQMLAGLAALSLTTSSFAQPPAPAPATSAAPADFSADAFRTHVTFLADDLLEGREAGTRGYDLAARYVATQFAALGLRPAGPNGGWYQNVQFTNYTPGGNATITVGDHVFRQGEQMSMRASPNIAALSIDAPLVFVGYGLDAPAQGYDDYRGLDVRGKIVVVLSGLPAGTPSDVAAHLNSAKRGMAGRRGAVGMITVRTRADSGTPWERVVRFGGRPGTTWLQPDGTPFSEDNGLRFAAGISEQAAETLFARGTRRLSQVLDEAGRAGTRPRGFALNQNARVAREAGTETRFSSPNVVAILPGSDPSVANEYVLLMAHLDHIGIRAPRPNDAADADRINNGALDNATGIATLIETARVFSRPGNRPRRPILIAAVTAEEKGLLGAEFLAHHPVTGNGRVVSVVNLDMPILTYDFQDVIAFGAEHSTMGPITARAAAQMGVRLAPDPLPEEGLFVRSDHYGFVRVGVPSVFLMTGFSGDGEREFRGFLTTRYHTPADDLNQSINWQAGAKFARLNYLIAREIANGPEVPRWYRGSFFGEMFGGTQDRAVRPAAAR